ncbi:glycosyltransferase family A protein [Capnocytophaga sp. G2]|uniref:glycosyltransferase n=1 Tax=Capnocytophaga sp. G2 TaxID=3110695 RepID=UPI002B475428|nr:glycosyltransferase family A protein [Capnocytophaga sp. G2]MEB3004373.1 glycosyltransferase family A protein [Capnocytophaga sp. G2]
MKKRFGIIIPAHNEGNFLSQTLDSLLGQSFPPHQIIVIDDNSTDNTQEILSVYCARYSNVQKLYRSSSEYRLPGAKIVQAFNSALPLLSEVEIICKFDADLIFPANYLATLEQHYTENSKLGMCGGVCSIEKEGGWIVENLTNKNHLRGALKSYRKECFEAIGGLREAMGWDTVDELLAQYHQWEVMVDKNLIVKHLRPTASAYNKQAQYLQGGMFYRLRYGEVLSFLASAKLAYRKKSFSLLRDYIKGYFKAKKEKQSFLVNENEGKWIRKYRWKAIRKKF